MMICPSDIIYPPPTPNATRGSWTDNISETDWLRDTSLLAVGGMLWCMAVVATLLTLLPFSTNKGPKRRDVALLLCDLLF